MDEQAEALQRRASGLQCKAQKQWIDKCLAQRADLIPAVAQHLRSLGCKGQPDVVADGTFGPRTPGASPAKSDGKQECKSSSGPDLAGSACQPADDSAPASSGSQPEESEGEETNPKGVLPCIPKKYKTWENVPTSYLCAVLKAMEPVAFSQANLRSFHPKGSKYLLKDPP